MNRVFFPTRQVRSAFGDLASDVENIMEQILGDAPGSDGVAKYAPRLDISETELAFAVAVDLPGVNPDDVNVELNEEELTISGAREARPSDEGTKYHRVERVEGQFRRVVTLPSAVDRDKIEATFEAGVLTVSLPKSEKILPTKIAIKAS